MAKIRHRMDAAHLVNYLEQEAKHAKILKAEGVSTVSKKACAEDFQSHVDECGKGHINCPFGHIALSWHVSDKAKLNEDLMVKIAEEYMRRMGIMNTQYLIVLHNDKAHPHVHLLYNRVNYDGNLISDSNERIRSWKVCRAITEEYGFYMAPGKKRKQYENLRGLDAVRENMRQRILTALECSRCWRDFQDELSKAGISISFRYSSKGLGIAGIVFSDGRYSFGGKKLDNNLRFQAIDERFGSVFREANYLTTPGKEADRETAFMHHSPEAVQPDEDAELPDWITIPFRVAYELIVQPHMAITSGGGGGSNNQLTTWDGRKIGEKDKEYKPKFRR